MDDALASIDAQLHLLAVHCDTLAELLMDAADIAEGYDLPIGTLH